jgi:hypothetical protein
MRVVPGVLAEEAIRAAEVGAPSHGVPDADRAAVEAALDARRAVPEDEYDSLSGRFEVMQLIADMLAARRARS